MGKEAQIVTDQHSQYTLNSDFKSWSLVAACLLTLRLGDIFVLLTNRKQLKINASILQQNQCGSLTLFIQNVPWRGKE